MTHIKNLIHFFLSASAFSSASLTIFSISSSDNPPEAFDISEHERVDTDADLVTCQNGGIEVALLGEQVIALDHTIASFRLFDLA